MPTMIREYKCRRCGLKFEESVIVADGVDAVDFVWRLTASVSREDHYTVHSCLEDSDDYAGVADLTGARVQR